MGETCLLPMRHPVWRWRELGSGSGAKRGNLRPDAVTGSSSHKRENLKQQKLQGAEYREGTQGRIAP